MKKRTRRVNKKLVLIILGVLVLGGLAGGYWYYTQYQQKQAAIQQARHEKAQAEVEDIAFKGDRELATAFVEQINQENPQAAGQVYLDQIEATNDTTQKMALYRQYGTFASQYNLHDQALQAALGANELQSSYMTLAEVARVYGLLGDTTKQIEYLKKTIAAVNALPLDEQNKKNMITMYQEIINTAREQS
ncbi:MAG TPA: hypothetical protein VFM68_04155 [Candidatus Saccharimonadales bacterium]|nr:hypothetical protein [Candidatus Saccharimonadales bacterium]